MRKIFLFALLLCPMAAFGKTLTKINLLSPPDGYHMALNASTVQLTPQCSYSDSATDACVGETLTWGSSNQEVYTVNSSGLVTIGPGDGGSVTSIARSANVVTVTLASPYKQTQMDGSGNWHVLIRGAADASFNGDKVVTGTPTTSSFTYASTGANASTTGAKVYIGLYSVPSPDIYAYAGTILGHYAIRLDTTVPTQITMRPETTSTSIVLGTTVLVSALDSSVDATTGPGMGDYCAYTSSAPAIASVNNIGEVTGNAVGSAVITCTYYGLTATRTVTVTSPTLPSNTWYVRPDGGTRYDAAVTTGQCNGLSNAAYPGTGTNQPCAFNNPMYLVTDETSSTVYTGALQAGDTAIIAPGTTAYLVGSKTPTVPWVTSNGSAFTPPSGTPSQHTKILGSNYASCSTDPYHIGNRTALRAYYDSIMFDLRGVQNLDMQCLDMSTGWDCQQGLTGYTDFGCPSSINAMPIMADDFTSNINLTGERIHGFETGWNGTPGPGLVLNNVVSTANNLDGFNFDDPYGYNGNRTDGMTAIGLVSNYNGCTDEQDKSLTAVSRDGTGHINATFAAGEIVNYLVNTNLVLQGMTPSDLNGTYPVSSIVFDQQSASITGGSCANPGGASAYTCTFTTSAAPAFASGSFVQIAGASPAYLNGTYEVYSVIGTGFVINASASAHPGWSYSATIAAGGTAKTAITLAAVAAGSSETATTVGTATHVHPVHRCMDQGSGGYANGDGVGTGNNTIGSWKCDKCTLRENTQDGWDMLHSAMQESSFTNSLSEGNEGAPAKFGDMNKTSFTNNILIGNCSSLLAFDPNKPADFNQYLALPCRADDALEISTRAWSQVVISNNVLMSNQNVLWDDACVDQIGCNALPTISQFISQNNLFLGFTSTNNPVWNSSVPTIYYTESPPAVPNWTWKNNMAGLVTRNPPTSDASNNWSIDPKIVTMIPNITTLSGETAALTFDVHLTATSPAIGAGIQNSYVPATDFGGSNRPNPPSIGAWEYITNVIRHLFSGSSAISGSGSIN